MQQQKGPFVKASKKEKHVKLFIYGDSGTGKTTAALNFPDPCMIDLESGSELYGDKYDFDVMSPTPQTIEQLKPVLGYLKNQKHDYRTLIIDPLTIVWDMMVAKWYQILLSHRPKGEEGKEFYEFLPLDWMKIKGEWKQLITAIINLQMNVVCIARQKPMYAPGGKMTKIGDTFDCEKSTDYLFDIVVRLHRNTSKFWGSVLKDRSEKLPQTIEKPREIYSLLIDKPRIDPVLDAKVTQMEIERGFVDPVAKPVAKSFTKIHWVDTIVPNSWLPQEIQDTEKTYRMIFTDKKITFMTQSGKKQSVRQYMSYNWNDEPDKNKAYLELKELEEAKFFDNK